MKTIEIEVAVMKVCNIRQNIVVTNVSWGIHLDYQQLHECDILSLSQRGYATEFEIKVSKGDLLNDLHKRHHHQHPLIARLYYAVPENLKEIALQSIPESAGLYVVRDEECTIYNYSGVARTEIIRRVDEVRPAKRNTKAVIWNDHQRYSLARLGAMRILGLKEKIVALSITPTKVQK